MELPTLQQELKFFLQDKDGKEFPEIIRGCREAIGLKMVRASEFAGIPANKLKNLEDGKFQLMPDDDVILSLALLYGLDYEELHEKAKEYTDRRKRVLKVQIMPEGKAD